MRRGWRPGDGSWRTSWPAAAGCSRPATGAPRPRPPTRPPSRSGAGGWLAAGKGGWAAKATPLTSELVGRYRDDRPPFSAIALCSESSALTAMGNDYGAEAVFARQVRAHGRPGDVFLALSTSG